MKSKNATWIVAAVLVVQCGFYYGTLARAEKTPGVNPLSAFPATVGPWHLNREFPLEKEVAEVLKADDTLNRFYVNDQSQTSASLFMAYFKTQRFGQAPHSPKNCLPGSGWEPIQTGTLAIDVDGWSKPIVVNRYVVAHGAAQSVVMYWYHSHNRVIASEYWAKLWLVADAVRYNRSDTALVRVIVPVRDDAQAATKAGVDLIRSIFPEIVRQFPS